MRPTNLPESTVDINTTTELAIGVTWSGISQQAWRTDDILFQLFAASVGRWCHKLISLTLSSANYAVDASQFVNIVSVFTGRKQYFGISPGAHHPNAHSVKGWAFYAQVPIFPDNFTAIRYIVDTLSIKYSFDTLWAYFVFWHNALYAHIVNSAAATDPFRHLNILIYNKTLMERHNKSIFLLH